MAALAVGEGHQVQLPKVMAGAGDAVHVWDTVMAVVPQATVEDVYDLEATILSVVVPALHPEMCCFSSLVLLQEEAAAVLHSVGLAVASWDLRARGSG